MAQDRIHTRIVTFDLTRGKAREFPRGKVSAKEVPEHVVSVAQVAVPGRRDPELGGNWNYAFKQRTVVVDGERIVLLFHH